MKSVSLREFQLNANKFLGEEITLTRYNIPVARVVPIGELKSGEKILKKNSDVETDAPPADLFVKCSVLNCMEEATATVDLVDVPMCQKHAVQSLREALK